MRRRGRGTLASTSGLVPMADMLSNTVGIMLFILAFTVLHTGGVLIPKRLPMERESDDRQPLYFVCWNHRLMPLDSDLSDQLSEGLGELTYENASEWVSGFNSARAEDDYFLVMPSGEAHYSRGAFENSVKLELTVSYRPKENMGDSLGGLTNENSTFSDILRSLSRDRHFLYFLVYPGDIEVFREARDYAETDFGIGCGWGPIGEGNPIRFNLSGGGGITPVDQ